MDEVQITALALCGVPPGTDRGEFLVKADEVYGAKKIDAALRHLEKAGLIERTALRRLARLTAAGMRALDNV